MKRDAVAGPSISISGRGKSARATLSSGKRAPSPPPHPSAHQLDAAARFLRLLGDPNRLCLLLLLHRIGDLPVFELAARSDMQPSAVSHAMRLLRAHEVVGSRREGRNVVYFLRSSDVAAVLDGVIP